MCCIAVFFSADKVELPTRVYRNFTVLVLRLSTFRKHFLLLNLALIHSKPSSTDNELKIQGKVSNTAIFSVLSENRSGKLVHKTSSTFASVFWFVCTTFGASKPQRTRNYQILVVTIFVKIYMRNSSFNGNVLAF